MNISVNGTEYSIPHNVLQTASSARFMDQKRAFKAIEDAVMTCPIPRLRTQEIVQLCWEKLAPTMGRPVDNEGQIHVVQTNAGTTEFVSDEDLDAVSDWMEDYPTTLKTQKSI